jgi:hypothetical protein
MERTGAWLLLAALMIETFGLAWDIQWHSDVGPDTFFTAPHLVMYIGTATAGLASLAVVLYRTFLRPDSTVRSVNVLRTFRAPVPFLVSGLGAAGTLLYGLADLWWHTVYGFDATPTSPPHVAMSLCSLVTVCGGVMAFSSLRESQSGRVGLAVYMGGACYATIFLLLSTPALPFVLGIPLAVVVMCVLGLVMTAAITRSPGLVIVSGLSFAAIHGVSWFVVPAVTRAYATAIGLPLRDYVDGTPMYGAFTPFALLPVALLVAGALALGKRLWSPRIVAPVAGAIAATVLSIGYLVQLDALDAATVVASAVLGLGAGWIGWRASAPLRTLAEV